MHAFHPYGALQVMTDYFPDSHGTDTEQCRNKEKTVKAIQSSAMQSLHQKADFLRRKPVVPVYYLGQLVLPANLGKLRS
jgi:hypothetical protein